MRQAGIIAAAGLYGLEHNVDRLADDHGNAKLIADRLRNAGATVRPRRCRPNRHLRDDATR